MAPYLILFLNVFLFGRYVTSSPLSDSCTVSNYNDVAAAAKNCATLTLGNIVIPAKKTLKIDLKTGAKLIFNGYVSHEPAEWTGDLIIISGSNVEVYGTDQHLLDGLGPQHWHASSRPKFLRLKLKQNSKVHNLRLKNCPKNCILLQSSDLVLSDITIDNKDGYSQGAKNTDGFDISSGSNIRIQNSVVYNQDDCVAINSGHDFVIDNLFCSGSHGLSFSVKSGDVYNVQFKNSHVENSLYALHIKTHNDGGAGHIRNVVYDNISVKDIQQYGIFIQENYPTGDAKANIPITNLTLNNIQGSMTGGQSMAALILCAANGCSDWKWSGINIYGAGTGNVCQNVPYGIPC